MAARRFGADLPDDVRARVEAWTAMDSGDGDVLDESSSAAPGANSEGDAKDPDDPFAEAVQ